MKKLTKLEAWKLVNKLANAAHMRGITAGDTQQELLYKQAVKEVAELHTKLYNYFHDLSSS